MGLPLPGSPEYRGGVEMTDIKGDGPGVEGPAAGFLLPGWSVKHRDGQYRAAWPKKTQGRFQSGSDD